MAYRVVRSSSDSLGDSSYTWPSTSTSECVNKGYEQPVYAYKMYKRMKMDTPNKVHFETPDPSKWMENDVLAKYPSNRSIASINWSSWNGFISQPEGIPGWSNRRSPEKDSRSLAFSRTASARTLLPKRCIAPEQKSSENDSLDHPLTTSRPKAYSTPCHMVPEHTHSGYDTLNRTLVPEYQSGGHRIPSPERRHKNNLAAKKSRMKRKNREIETEKKLEMEENNYSYLLTMLASMRATRETLQKKIFAKHLKKNI